MKILSNFLKLSWTDKQLIIKALFLMINIRLMLWLLPFSYVQKSINKNRKKSKKMNISVKKLIWAVKAVSFHLPYTTCLTNALTGYLLFSKHGYTSLIKIGVGKDSEGQFEAHAWLEKDNNVVIGESDKDYVPLLDLKEN